jgi:ABC-type antimicrobial peptide transport system permease subunit
MLVFFVAAGVFGVLAAILPARRAARLDILAAIQMSSRRGSPS